MSPFMNPDLDGLNVCFFESGETKIALVQLRESQHPLTPIFWGTDEMGTLTGRERVIGDEMAKAMEIVSTSWSKRHHVMDEAPTATAKRLEDLNLLGRLYWALTKRVP